VSFSLLLERLQQSDFYPHPVASPIQVIQTHISVVFLTGDYAYKLKKSVDFGFLDFSTREKRQFCLEEELRLNQPIAPDIYLEVLPIVEKNNDLFLNQEG
jgi:aminoglycoside phosphotransferase family enzyme